VEAFEGNRAETATMLPVINAFKAAHQLTDVTVVADAGMISEANQGLAAKQSVVTFGTSVVTCRQLGRQAEKQGEQQVVR
jgi:predicted Fe-Mo cluster-binding NifX family protein